MKVVFQSLSGLDLSHTQNNISFEFSSIHFSRPAKNRISYKLEGFNNHWIRSDRSFASFTNLDPGDYTFRVKGSNGDGIWNEEGRSIKIAIYPPWWQTTMPIFHMLHICRIVFAIDEYKEEEF